MKEIKQKFSERHCRIILYTDGTFDAKFIAHGKQYQVTKKIPSDIPEKGWKALSGALGNEFYQNKIKKLKRDAQIAQIKRESAAYRRKIR